MRTIQSIRLDNFLSFAPGAEWFDLSDLNVLIGPNGAGKSNVVEAFELLHAAPGDFAAAIREGGGAQEWLWKGKASSAKVTLEARIGTPIETLGHHLAFSVVRHRAEIEDEKLWKEPSAEATGYLVYRTPEGTLMRQTADESWIRGSDIPEARDMPPLSSDQSILSQYRSVMTLGVGGALQGHTDLPRVDVRTVHPPQATAASGSARGSAAPRRQQPAADSAADRTRGRPAIQRAADALPAPFREDVDARFREYRAVLSS